MTDEPRYKMKRVPGHGISPGRLVEQCIRCQKPIEVKEGCIECHKLAATQKERKRLIDDIIYPLLRASVIALSFADDGEVISENGIEWLDDAIKATRKEIGE